MAWSGAANFSRNRLNARRIFDHGQRRLSSEHERQASRLHAQRTKQLTQPRRYAKVYVSRERAFCDVRSKRESPDLVTCVVVLVELNVTPLELAEFVAPAPAQQKPEHERRYRVMPRGPPVAGFDARILLLAGQPEGLGVVSVAGVQQCTNAVAVEMAFSLAQCSRCLCTDPFRWSGGITNLVARQRQPAVVSPAVQPSRRETHVPSDGRRGTNLAGARVQLRDTSLAPVIEYSRSCLKIFSKV